jgi:hypothetical protein
MPLGLSNLAPRRLAGAFLGLAMAAAAISAHAQSEYFSYAEKAFPAEFPGSPATQFLRPYVARAYSSGNYLGFADERAYVSYRADYTDRNHRTFSAVISFR